MKYLSALFVGVLAVLAPATSDARDASAAEQGVVVKLDLMKALALSNDLGTNVGWSPGRMFARATFIFQEGRLHFVATTQADANYSERAVLDALKQPSKFSAETSAAVSQTFKAYGAPIAADGTFIVDLSVSPGGCNGSCSDYKTLFDGIAKRIDGSVVTQVGLAQLPTPMPGK